MRSLRNRLVVTTILIVLACTAVVSGLLAHAFENIFVTSLAERMSAEAFLISNAVGANPWDPQAVQAMQSYATNLSPFTGSRITIIARDGTVLGDSMENPKDMENHASRPEVITALGGRVGVSVRYSSTLKTDMMYVAVPARQNDAIRGVVRVALPLTAVKSEEREIWVRALQVALLGVAVSVVLVFLVSNRMVKPIREMMHFARKVSQGDLSSRVSDFGYEETSRLGMALNHMASVLDQRLRQIEDTNNMLQTVLGNMVSGVLVIGAENRITLANRAALKILNMSLSDLLNKHYIEGLRNYELSELISRAVKTASVQHAEIHLIRPTDRVIEVSVQPIKASSTNEQRAVVVLYDITEMRNLARARSDFVANVSHELRTPVTSIKGFAETLLEAEPQDMETIKEFALIIRDEADRLSRLIADLLELSHVETMRNQVVTVPEDLCSIVSQAVSYLKPQFESAGLKLETNMPQQPVYALANRDMVLQVITNLLDNAMKYTPAGGSVWIRVKDVQEHARVEVEDTGIGIPASDLERVFERFYRVDKDRSRRTGGTGLGLSISKHIVESLGGRIGVESTLGKGSLFWFTLREPEERKNAN